MNPFYPRYLTGSQLEPLYRQALAQAEAAVLDAWIHQLLQPEDPTARALYEARAQRLEALEADLRRLQQAGHAAEG